MTLRFPIDKSWDSSDQVHYSLIQKPLGPTYCYSSLFHDQSSNSLYAFGGEKSLLDSLPVDLSIWKLQLNGTGDGFWYQNTSYTQSPFVGGPAITRPIGAGFAQSNDTALLLGGYSSPYSSPATQSHRDFIPTPGLVSYDFGNGVWANSTAGVDSVSPSGNFEFGGMEFVSTFGPNGLVVIWGGETSGDVIYTLGAEMRPMDTVTLYDPVTRDWYTQQTSGTAPSPRSRFCSMHVADSRPLSTAARNGTGSGTHEIYMYGGYKGQVGSAANDQYDEIWALSLPSFTWQQVDASHTQARFGHTCHLVGHRQMITIGGGDPSQEIPWNVPDIFSNGIGIFDLTESEWTTGYNATAAPYKRPKILQDYYDKKSVLSSPPHFPKTHR